MSDIKKFMYLNRRAPYGTIYAWESLEVILIGAAFDQEVSLMCMDDGVYQLVKGSDTSESDMKNFMPTYRTLGDYGCRHMYVDKASLEARGLTTDDLDADLAKLREHGLEIYVLRDTPTMRMAFVETPDNVRVEIIQPLG